MSDELREDAFLEDAMERYGDAVYRLALCRLGSRADAEDVYQDVFLRLLRDTTAFCDGEHLKAWLLRVTLHCCVDLRRSAWWLPADLRTAVWLHYVEGYGTDEIAEIVNCRPATVRTRLHRARKKLQTELEGELNDEHVGRNEEYQGAGRAEGADSRGGA